MTNLRCFICCFDCDRSNNRLQNGGPFFYRHQCVKIPNVITHHSKACWIMSLGIPYVIIGRGGGINKTHPSVLL